MENAYAAYLDAVNNYPTSYDSYSALLTLVEHEQPVDELNRGIVDYYAGQYGVALAAFDRYLQSSMADPGAAYYYNGLTYQATGGYEDAITQWEKIIANYPKIVFGMTPGNRKPTPNGNSWATTNKPFKHYLILYQPHQPCPGRRIPLRCCPGGGNG
jgi:soluble lytic murein transglycosylase